MLRDNPVLTRELLVTLRSSRAFVLQLLYVCALGALVFFQASKPPSSVSALAPACLSQAATPWLSFRPFWQTTTTR